MANHRSRNRRSAREDAQREPGPDTRSASPPQPSRPLLTISGALMLGWIAFLLVVALSVKTN